MSPHLTLLIPVYNGIEFLEECIISVIAQTYPHWTAIIAVNGHGEDGGEVAVKVRDLATRDSRIQVIVQGPPLKGKVESLNRAMESVGDEWIALLDCDDKWEPTKLEKQVEAILGEGCDADVIGTHCHIFGERDSAPILPGGYIDPGLLEQYNPVVNSSSLIKRKWCHWEYNEVNEYAIEDYYLWMRVCLEGGRLYNVPEKLTWHRVYSTSAFNSKHYSNAKLLAWYREKRRGL
jgi:glycosyltransferase involved in cell wall biosynthesis